MLVAWRIEQNPRRAPPSSAQLAPCYHRAQLAACADLGAGVGVGLGLGLLSGPGSFLARKRMSSSSSTLVSSSQELLGDHFARAHCPSAYGAQHVHSRSTTRTPEEGLAGARPLTLRLPDQRKVAQSRAKRQRWTKRHGYRSGCPVHGVRLRIRLLRAESRLGTTDTSGTKLGSAGAKGVAQRTSKRDAVPVLAVLPYHTSHQ